MIVRIEDFRNEASIMGLYADGNAYDSRQDAIVDTLTEYIEKYEPMLMEQLFNPDNIAEIIAYNELEEDGQTDERLNNVLRILRVSIAYYVSFHYQRRQMITPIGAIKAGADEGIRVTSTNTLVIVWNQMVDNNIMLHRYYYHTQNYPYNDVFTKINAYNL